MTVRMRVQPSKGGGWAQNVPQAHLAFPHEPHAYLETYLV